MVKQNNQNSAPFFSMIQSYLAQKKTGFHTPGHRGGISLGYRWRKANVTRMDLTELSGLEWEENKNTAERLAASLYQADQSFFLIQGASQGIHAAMLGCFNPGDYVLITRNCHISVFHGLILADLNPVFLEVDYVSGWGIPAGVNHNALRKAIADHPHVKGVILTNPTYQGIAIRLDEWRNILGDRILIIDEAHGGHIGWWGPSQYNASYAADLWVQGTHKFFGSLTQTAMLHLRSGRVDPDKIHRSLKWITTTSPSYILMASLDANRAFLAEKGQHLFSSNLQKALALKAIFSALPGVKVLTEKDVKSECIVDPWRLSLSLLDLGLTGYAIDRELREKYGIQVEYADYNQVTLLIPPWQSERELHRLRAAVRRMSKAHFGEMALVPLEYKLPVNPVRVSPRKIATAQTEMVLLDAAVCRLAVEVIAPYPPGIPLVGPGEQITQETVEILKRIQTAGGSIEGVNARGEIRISKIEA